MTSQQTQAIGVDMAQQSGKLLGHYAGYVATWTINLGLQTGIFHEIADRPEGLSADHLAARLGLDPSYTRVWCRAAYAAGLLDLHDDGGFTLAPHMATLLLNTDAPGYLGGLNKAFVAMRETFLDLREFIRTGQREWWNDFGPEWINAVGDTGQAFYRRLLNVVVPQLPEVQQQLEAGGRILDLACGVCRGPIKIARAYPNTTFTGVDGDAYTLDVARDILADHGLADRFELVHSMLEDLALPGAYDLAIINISLHEARDIERVVKNAFAALKPGGVFLVNEFPFPETIEECRTLPNQIMCGIQFFEAHIGCQLLPVSRFTGLLQDAGFRDVSAIHVTPVHVTVHGTR